MKYTSNASQRHNKCKFKTKNRKTEKQTALGASVHMQHGVYDIFLGIRSDMRYGASGTGMAMTTSSEM
jgi:hypothetical protein